MCFKTLTIVMTFGFGLFLGSMSGYDLGYHQGNDETIGRIGVAMGQYECKDWHEIVCAELIKCD